MGKEIERKFLVKSDAYRSLAKGVPYRQGYLNSANDRVVRVRTTDGRGFLTIKGASTGAVRTEFEYEIPRDDAETMLDRLCEKPLVEKTRYRIFLEGLYWEVDEFSGENEGLRVAEVELEREDQPFTKPGWIGAEVTGDPRYFNSSLVRMPFKKW